MANIFGGVTSINNPRTNWAQTDSKKADYLKNKPSVANALKGHKSGAAISADDVSPIEHGLDIKVTDADGVPMEGVVVKQYGKNLLPYPYYDRTKTIKGVTFTDNGDGTITVNGTAEADIDFYLYANYIEGELIKDTEIPLHLSGCPKGGSNETYYIFAGWVGIKDHGNGVSLPKIKNRTKSISIHIMSGFTANNLVFTPQLEVGTRTTEYEPYREPVEAVSEEDGSVKGLPCKPTMTLISDEGVVIDCTYNRDANKVITDLETKLNTLVATIGG